jgi:putative copper export protein
VADTLHVLAASGWLGGVFFLARANAAVGEVLVAAAVRLARG